MKSRKGVILCAVLLALFLSVNNIEANSFVEMDRTGGYLDKIVYHVIESSDQQVLALQNSEIDLIGAQIDPAYIATLEAAENIAVANRWRNGYGYITINCDKYPYNLTSFRRALAFALDKDAICDDIWNGLATPLDSVVPYINPFSIEGLLSYSYNESNVVLGNYILDTAGFEDWDGDGIREAPDGTDFDVIVEVAQSSNVAIDVGSYVASALSSLNIDAASVPTDFYEYLNRLYFHGDYDIVFLGQSFSDFDVDWLAYEYWSEYADENYWNFPNFRNATYDSWRDQLLHGATFEEVYEAAIEMQRILVYQSPIIVCYESMLHTAYRTDKFEGFVNDVSDGIPSYWTNYRTRLKSEYGGPIGGTLRWANPLDVDSFNFMVTSSSASMNVLQMLYDSLIRIDESGADVLWLAESVTTETHADNPAVSEGYTRFTFEVIQNATWTDGTPLTANDVAFSMNYYRDSPGNPYGTDLTELSAAYAPTTYTAVMEFNTESYWHLHTIGYKPIIPKHIFQEIGLENWNTWNPIPPNDEMVTSGPYNVSEYVAGEFTELTYNPSYFYSRPDYPSGPTLPEIQPHQDLIIFTGTTGNELVWSTSDDNPEYYSVYKNGTIYQSGSWSGGSIFVDIDGLPLGTYNFTLEVRDLDGHTARDEVIVTVLESLPPVEHSNKIVLDYSHGQENTNLGDTDYQLEANLSSLGYEVIWARGGINESILSDAGGLVLSSIYGAINGFTNSELTAIENWFMQGNRFLWVAFDNDFGDTQYIHGNMTTILESVGSHVYGEPTAIEDPESNAAAAYRAVANITSNDAVVSEIVENVSNVLMHGPTCLYGSTLANPDSGTIDLEQQSISNVYPLLYYSPAATITDSDLIPPKAHLDGQTGSFVAACIELKAGLDGSGVIVTSGASPYGDYRPMCTELYYDVILDGYNLVAQAIDFGMRNASVPEEENLAPSSNSPEDIEYELGDSGNKITWKGYDSDPAGYHVLRNGTLYASGVWNSSGETIDVVVDGLPVGTHNMTITLNDTIGQKCSDTVWVTVTVGLAPHIDHPPDVFMIEGFSGYEIVWDPQDSNPSHFIILVNGSATMHGLWNSTSEKIAVNLDGTMMGTYNYTIRVNDTAGNQASDSVLVIVSDNTAPVVSSPQDINIEQGQEGHAIIWEAFDLHPFRYEIYLNGSLHAVGLWNESSDEISLSLDGFDVGVYEVSIVIYDSSGNTASDSVLVTVTESSGGEIDPLLAFLISSFGIVLVIGSIGIILVLLVLIRRR